jgi:predicted nuclease with TOPRIM domain
LTLLKVSLQLYQTGLESLSTELELEVSSDSSFYCLDIDLGHQRERMVRMRDETRQLKNRYDELLSRSDDEWVAVFDNSNYETLTLLPSSIFNMTGWKKEKERMEAKYVNLF